MKASKVLFLAGFLLGVSIESAVAAPPVLVDPQTGKYLGNYSSNQYDPNSTSNPYGQYGSKYSADSVNNPYGQYGSKYSPNSPNNPYATGAGGIAVPSVPSIWE